MAMTPASRSTELILACKVFTHEGNAAAKAKNAKLIHHLAGHPQLSWDLSVPCCYMSTGLP
jgi:hypothetical protein